MIYLQLFLSFLQIGALSFGGGYAAMPLIQAQIVTQHSWLTMSEFTDLVTIAEMTPGPIAVNAATFVGTKIGGVPGALIATAGEIPYLICADKIYARFGAALPALIAMLFLAARYAMLALSQAAPVALTAAILYGGGLPVITYSMNRSIADRVAKEAATAGQMLYGVICTGGDQAALDAAVLALAQDAARREALGRAACRTITELWNAETAARRLVALCRTLPGAPAYPDGPCSAAPLLLPRKAYRPKEDRL